ncbi:MAG TPA: cysteine--tRNA ligase [Candidatus Methylacidiphilales bacterium]|nr:cysteine--tRNA ligase [Candidatus Methylacidiphilales bacterium]
MPEPTFHLYNTMSRAVEPLAPLHPPKVTLYVCGPTIYDYAHIGNFRTYVAVDLLRRALKHFDYQVDHVMQFTDVDDKTIKGARAKNTPLKEYTATFGKAFLEDAKTLNIEIPERTPNATDFIPSMVALIQKLIDKKAAYVSDDGSVYFRIASFPKYGCLCHLDLAGMISGARVNQDEYEKEGVGDFVLWKKWVEADGDVGWDSPWGKGRPGWHIECSALSMEHLGPQIDIHGGGVDLRFPHHENEIAQSEAATGLPFVRHWFHVEHLLVDGQKMSKSLGNMYTIRDVLQRGFTGRELRYALISGAAYAKNLNFTWHGMEDAKTALARIDEWRKRVKQTAAEASDPGHDTGLAQKLRTDFDKALASDLNIADVLGQLFQWIRETNKSMDGGLLSRSDAAVFDSVWGQVDSVLGLGDASVAIPPEVQKLVEDRAAARKGKDFAKSDELRKAIESLGWKVKDTAKGQEVTKA